MATDNYDGISSYTGSRAAEKQSKSIQYIAGRRPITARRRMLEFSVGRVNINPTNIKNVTTIFVLNVSRLGGTDLLE